MSKMSMKEIYDTVHYHIDNKMIINVERNFNGDVDTIMGFPLRISDNLLLINVINDFHDEGYSLVRTKDISDIYSKESDKFYEKICKLENVGCGEVKVINDISNMPISLEQLKNYDGLLSVQCEGQIEKCTFYLGKIIELTSDSILFRALDMFGKWDKDPDNIPIDEITQMTFGDNYSKMFFKYVEK